MLNIPFFVNVASYNSFKNCVSQNVTNAVHDNILFTIIIIYKCMHNIDILRIMTYSYVTIYSFDEISHYIDKANRNNHILQSLVLFFE